MKILLLAHIEPTGGTGTYYKRVISFLLSQGHEVVPVLKHEDLIVSANTDTFPDLEYHTYSKHYKLDYFFYRCFRKVNLLNFYLLFRDRILIRHHVKVIKPDFIFISQGGGFEYFGALSTHLPTLCIIHSLFTKSKEDLYFKALKKLEKIFKFNSNKAIIHVSNNANDLYNKFSPFKNFKTIVIPNYADPFNESKTIHETLNIFTAGHLQGWKNPILWAECALSLCQKYKHVNFYWAGSGHLYDEVYNLVKNCDQIHLLGFITNMPDYYKIADIYFQPSISESQGIAVINALAAGIPCVVSNVGGLPDSITNKLEGFLCNPTDKTGFINSLSILIEDEELRKLMGANGKRKYNLLFTQQQWTKSMEAAFNSVLLN